MNDTILLIGAGGQLGSEWRQKFNQREIPFIPANSSDIDITDQNAVDQLIDRTQPDMIINCAGYTDVDRSETDHQQVMRVNRDGVRHLAEAAYRHDAKLIHYSTDYVFPGYKEDKERFSRGYNEEAPVNPVNFYGKSKLEGERALRENHDNFIIMRISWLNGVYGHNFIKTIIRLSRSKDEIKVVNDQFGAPTLASNVVRNTLNLIQNDFRGTIHLSCGGLATWYDVAKKVLDHTGANTKLIPVSTEEFGGQAARPYYSKLDTGKLRSFEGSRIINWQDGIDQLLQNPRFKVD